jgi:cytochrome b561
MKASRHPPVLRVLHWAIAALIIAALLLGTFVMAPLPNSDPAKVFALGKHMAAGFLLLALSLVRLVVRPRTRRLAPVLTGMAWADWIVPLVHRVFDALALAMIVSGIGIALASGLPAIVFGGHGRLPVSFDEFPMHTLHVLVARVLAGFVALHVGGALYHHFVLKDGLLSRMSPVFGRRARTRA